MLISKIRKKYLLGKALKVLVPLKPDMFLIKNQNQMTNLPSVKYFSYIFSERLSGLHLKTGPKPASGPSVTKLPGGGLSKKHPVGGFWRRARMQGWQRRVEPSGRLDPGQK